jgi:oligosaccharide repeat unit polymerase
LDVIFLSWKDFQRRQGTFTVDMTLVVVGVGLIVYAMIMIAVYLWFERGSFLDPVVVSWAGYIAFIPISMIGVGILYPERDAVTHGKMGCILMVLGTAMYTLGLYSGKGIRFSARLPSPRYTITKAQIWIALLISIAIYPTFPLMWEPLFQIAGTSAGTVVYGLMFSITLIAVIGLVMLRGSPISRILMGAIAAAACVVILFTIFSRRPLAGVLIAGAGLFYHFRIAHRSALLKMWYFGGLMASVFVLLIYLDATRSERYYGKIAGTSLETFSSTNLQRFFGGVEMNYRVYEYGLQQIPSHHPYLYGSGYVPGICWFPRALWPSKPYGTGYVLSQIWYDKEAPESNVGLPTMGEAYANFGIPGVIVVLFLVGRVIRIMNTYLHIHTNNIIAWATWLLIVPDIVGEWRGDFTSMTSQAVLRVLAFLPIIWIAGKIAPSRTIRPTGPRRMGPMPQGNRLAWNGASPFSLQPQPRTVNRG